VSKFRFIVPEAEHAQLILDWRAKPWVADMMFNRIEHGVAEQQAWMAGCLEREDYRHWLIVAGERPIGLVNLQHIDWANRTTSNGYYIGEEDARPLGGFVLPYLYNHVFHDIGMREITAEVIADNDIMRLNRLLGNEETVEPGAFVRDGVAHDVIKLRLTRDKWDTMTRYKRYVAAFPWPATRSGQLPGAKSAED